MSNKLRYSRFFGAGKLPRDRGVSGCLECGHGKLPPHKVFDGWRKSLEMIIKCTDRGFSRPQRKRVGGAAQADGEVADVPFESDIKDEKSENEDWEE
ncbi:hypothetical protein HOY80DRAFT_1136040 [Tuber brumale]|nr:hypothetical protein HOY80DRAFT_1136040 [Tuber brumale]